ncbi:MAG: DUF1592 domain-containing protein [Lentisphaeraceae bacterium]|nr:DUF1592 domain-containing protein [Lentisphaeraceae bacterium]
MKKIFTILSCTLLSVPVLAQTSPTSNDPLGLSEARQLGRTKSSFLTPKKSAAASLEVPEANLKDFSKHIAPLLKNKCLDCHGPKKSKGKFRVDELDPNLLNGQDIAKWLEVYEVLSNSEMPPDDEPDYHLNDKDRSLFVDWLGEEMNKAASFRRNEGGHSSFRRMTKFEYNNALQDLLGKAWNFADDLPPETISEDGFTNSSEHLNMTGMQFETYRSLALKALKKTTFLGEKPSVIKYNIDMKGSLEIAKKLKSKEIDPEHKDYKGLRKKAHVINKATNKGFVWGWSYTGGRWGFKPDDETKRSSENTGYIAVLPRSQQMKIDLGNFLPDRGTLRVKIRAGRTTNEPNQFSGLRISFGSQTSNNAHNWLVVTKEDLQITAPVDKPEVITLDIPLEEVHRNPFKNSAKLGSLPNPAEVLIIQHIANGRDKKDQPLNVHIDHIEITSPIYEQWPPKSHTRVFPKSKNKDNEAAYAYEVLEKFISKAWRRQASKVEVTPFVKLFDKYRPEFISFEETMLEVYATVLATPEFLYITKQAPQDFESKEIRDIELASRLSYFLWSSIPDKELLDLAADGKLRNPKILNNQITRMLKDSKAERLSKNFVNEWLGLKALDHVTFTRKNFYYWNENFKNTILREPVEYFKEVLKTNGSIMDFIHSDYVVINERLANHYRIDKVYGPHFRKVPVTSKHNRGGILTTAVVLAMNSDGKDSNPLKRGIWLLEKILHDPPPPPPPNVPEVDLTDPEILKMTLKERMADHRNHPACKSCHMKIDPWGIAFENYSAIGQFRNKVKKKPVDATSTLFNKQKLKGITGLKGYLLVDRQDQFAKATVHKLASYALGRPLSFSDYADVDEITAKLRKSGDGLQDLIRLIVTSDMFHTH